MITFSKNITPNGLSDASQVKSDGSFSWEKKDAPQRSELKYNSICSRSIKNIFHLPSPNKVVQLCFSSKQRAIKIAVGWYENSKNKNYMLCKNKTEVWKKTFFAPHSYISCILQGELLGPCRCDGSVRCTHQSCLIRWISERGSWSCELCYFKYQVLAISTKNPLQVENNYVGELSEKYTSTIYYIVIIVYQNTKKML